MGEEGEGELPVLADTMSVSNMQPDFIIYDLQLVNEWKTKTRASARSRCIRTVPSTLTLTRIKHRIIARC